MAVWGGALAHMKGSTDWKQLFIHHLMRFLMQLIGFRFNLYLCHAVLMAVVKIRLRVANSDTPEVERRHGRTGSCCSEMPGGKE